jgi:hypothetical protein
MQRTTDTGSIAHPDPGTDYLTSALMTVGTVTYDNEHGPVQHQEFPWVTPTAQPGEAQRQPTFVGSSPWHESEALIWLLRLITVAVIAAGISTAHTRIDREEVSIPAYAIAAGHPSSAYPTSPQPTGRPAAFQPPGFPVFAAVFISAWDAATGERGSSGALTFAGFAAVAIVVTAGGWLVGAGPGWRRRELWFLLAVAVNPFFRESLGDYFHPEDVLALGLLLLSLCLASQDRWLWAGASLGLAIGCKQWALLAFPAVLLMASGRRAKTQFAGAALGCAAALYLPFAVLTPKSFFQIVRGPVPIAGGLVPQTTLIGMLREAPFHLSVASVNNIARLLPLLFAVLIAGVWAVIMVRRNGAVTPAPVDQVVGLILAAMAFRLIGDCIALSYYAAPLIVFVAIASARWSRFPSFAIVSSFALAFWYGTSMPRRMLGPWAGAAVFSLAVTTVAVGALLTLMGSDRQSRPRQGERSPYQLLGQSGLTTICVAPPTEKATMTILDLDRPDAL